MVMFITSSIAIIVHMNANLSKYRYSTVQSIVQGELELNLLLGMVIPRRNQRDKTPCIEAIRSCSDIRSSAVPCRVSGSFVLEVRALRGKRRRKGRVGERELAFWDIVCVGGLRGGFLSVSVIVDVVL